MFSEEVATAWRYRRPLISQLVILGHEILNLSSLASSLNYSWLPRDGETKNKNKTQSFSIQNMG